MKVSDMRIKDDPIRVFYYKMFEVSKFGAYTKTWSRVSLWSGALEWSGFWRGFLE